MEQLASIFGNLTRLKILSCLINKPKNVSQLIKTCNLSQSAVSQHLEKLRAIKLVKTEKKGREIYYQLTKKQAGKIAKQLLIFIKKL